jgi:hypothetical protein
MHGTHALGEPVTEHGRALSLHLCVGSRSCVATYAGRRKIQLALIHRPQRHPQLLSSLSSRKGNPLALHQLLQLTALLQAPRPFRLRHGSGCARPAHLALSNLNPSSVPDVLEQQQVEAMPVVPAAAATTQTMTLTPGAAAQRRATAVRGTRRTAVGGSGLQRRILSTTGEGLLRLPSPSESGAGAVLPPLVSRL